MQQIDAGDLETLDTFLPSSALQRKTLADLIFAKLDDPEGDEDENENENVARIKKSGEPSHRCRLIAAYLLYEKDERKVPLKLLIQQQGSTQK